MPMPIHTTLSQSTIQEKQLNLNCTDILINCSVHYSSQLKFSIEEIHAYSQHVAKVDSHQRCVVDFKSALHTEQVCSYSGEEKKTPL